MKINVESGQADTAVQTEGAEGIMMKILVGPQDGSEDIIMRLFTVSSGGHTPFHQHPWEHLIKVESGRGEVVDGSGRAHPLEPGKSVYVPPNEQHQFRNPNPETFQFICVIPDPKKKGGA